MLYVSKCAIRTKVALKAFGYKESKACQLTELPTSGSIWHAIGQSSSATGPH